MLSNLRRIHKPQTLQQAADLLKQPGTYPLYGSVGSTPGVPDIEEGVDLSDVVRSACSFDQNSMAIESGATLQTIIAAEKNLATILRQDEVGMTTPQLTLGDALMEARYNSLLLTFLIGIKTKLSIFQAEVLPIERWFDLSAEERRQRIVLGAQVPEFPETNAWSIALEQVGSTPADGPVVAAIGFARGGSSGTSVIQFYIAVCGLSDRPERHGPRDLPTLLSKFGDARGSVEYRTELGRKLSNAALMGAVSGSH